MKKVFALILALVMCIAIAGCNKAKNNNVEDSGVINDEVIKSEKSADPNTTNIQATMTYKTTSAKDLYDSAQLVVLGQFKEGTSKTLISSSELIITSDTLQISKVLKGDYTQSTVELQYKGGRMTKGEFADKLPDSAKKTGPYANLSPAERASFIQLDFSTQAKPKPNTQYLIMLNYDKKENIYIAAADTYSIREVSGTKAFNPKTGQMEELSFLQ